MSKRILKIEVEISAGDTTCWVQGKWCPHIRTTKFGGCYHCFVFNMKQLSDENGELSGPGMLQRLPECLKWEVPLSKEGRKGNV